MAETPVSVSIDGRTLRLSNMGKVLYPDAGCTKADVIDYYVAVADALLPRLAGRPVTLRRYPEGVEHAGFFEKNVSRHAPEWVRTARIATPGSTRGSPAADFVLIEDRPTLVWVANLAGLELHVPQWKVTDGHQRGIPDLLVFDLDPGDHVGIVECCTVAAWIRAQLTEDGLTAWPKTSGSKGLQLSVPMTARAFGDTARYAKNIAERLAAAHPELVATTMAKSARTGKVLIDWSQNNPAKTTITAYSLRARAHPTVSTPLTWAEVAACRQPEHLVFTTTDVRRRLETHGDLHADLDADHPMLPPVAD